MSAMKQLLSAFILWFSATPTMAFEAATRS